MAMASYSKADKAAWQRSRIAQHVAKGQLQPTDNINKFLAGKTLPQTLFPYHGRLAPQDALKGLPPAQFKEANKTANKLSKQAITAARKTQGVPRREIDGPAKAGKTLVATNESDCFDSLTWRNGIATATFAKDGSVYEYDVDLDAFIEWCGDSLGEYFNAEIR
jgi:hypothetical protein